MQMDPSFAINLQNAEDQFTAKGGQLSTQSTVVTIPVVVHVVYNTAAQNISDAQVQSQIDALNEDFRKLNADTVNAPSVWKPLIADSQIEFCLAQQDPNGNPTTGITRTFTNETSFTTDNKVKFTSQGGIDIWDRNQYMNIWVCPLGGSLGGYAQFPGGTAATDGIVVNYTVFGRAPYVNGAYNKGRVTVHEVGHWLNLRHIWGSGTCGDDFVNDTPIHASANYFCPTFPKISSCSGGDPNGEMFMNHMDYTNDGCKLMFTLGQATRMNTVLSPGGLRYSLLSSLGCQPPSGTPVCDTPTNFTATNITQTSALLSWIGAGANSYNVRMREAGTTTWTNGTSTGAVVNASGLTAATQYDFQAQSVCTGLNSSWSSTFNFTTSGAVCNVPTGLSAGNITTNSAQVSWITTGASSYNVRYRQNGTSTWTNTTSTSTSLNISSLSSATQYDYQVQSDCGGGVISVWSATSNFTTTTPICNIPSGISSGNITTNSAQITWNSTGALSYNVRYRQNGTSTWTNTTSTSTSLNISSLSSATQYDYQIQSDCGGGVTSSWSATSNFTTTTPICNIPSAISSGNITTNSAQITWNSTGASSYNIQYRITGTTTWSSVTTYSGPTIILSSLTPATQYDYHVQSDCNGNLSSWSNIKNFTTASTPCNGPSVINVDSVTYNSAIISWNNTGAVTYELEYKISTSGIWNTISTVATSYYVSGLDTGVTYEYHIRSICNGSISSFSVINSFTTLEFCTDPSSISLLDSSQSTISVQWDATNAASYEVRFKPEGLINWYYAFASAEMITLSGLIPETIYEIQVKSVCNSTNSNYSNSQLYQTAPACLDPQGINITVQNHNSVLVSWNNSTVLYYEFRYKETGTGLWNSDTVSVNQIQITNLLPAANYDFEVRCVCNPIDTSAYSQLISFNTTTSIPDESEFLNTSVYPNPVNDVLNLATHSIGELEVRIFNVIGEEVKKLAFQPQQSDIKAINFEDLMPGIYILKVNSGKKSQVHKLMKVSL